MSDFLDVHDPRQMAALFVFMEYNPDEIVATLVERFDVAHNAAVDLVAQLLLTRIEHVDKTERVCKQHLAAVAAEWDLGTSMYDDGRE